ncbi:MAG: twin-arginine translocation signal domain-containing protein [Phycisphaerales bacterium]|nr:twin-arginine translocation signal domain-containing protein [Phycisphaerales bacterium]
MKGDCGCGTGCGGVGVDRRSFIKTTGLGAAALGLAAGQAFAGPFADPEPGDHFVPEDKRLDAKWMTALFARGERTWYTATDLETIGMPVGGICAGQVYLSGDGRLVYWDIFNSEFNSGYGGENYKLGRKATEMFADGRFTTPPPVAQGAVLRVDAAGKTRIRELSAQGFPSVRFAGEYPIGFVEYAEEGFPIAISLEAFSPFVPLQTQDSSLPATVMRYRLRNLTRDEARVDLVGWLQNAACCFSAVHFADQAERFASIQNPGELAIAQGGVRKLDGDAKADPATAPYVFADFESRGYGDWTAEGEAFGGGPAKGTLANQSPVSAFVGNQLVNSYLGGDDRLQGRLLSPPFRIKRPFIGFLVGGGGHKDETCVNLLIDGRVVRTATGKNNERLEPCNWEVSEFAGRDARIEILDKQSGGWGHINVDQIEFRDTPMAPEIGPLEAQPDFGTMCVAAVGSDGVACRAVAPGSDAPGDIFAAFDARPVSLFSRAALGSDQRLIAGRTLTIPPGEAREVTLVYAWHMPNLSRARGSTEPRDRVGHQYSQRFDSAAAVATYVAKDLTRLADGTTAWHLATYDSTLPYWLLDRVGATTCNLATNTCHWWQDGRFWAWEGVGCCSGTCGHVWNYSHAMARLFPDLERSVRERQDFAPGVGFIPETGEIRFRGEGWGIWAGDAQGGYILKAYREHLCSGDDSFLKRNWTNIKKATEFLISQDGDGDGLIEGSQHQTYDENYFGANTMVGSLYLGALRSAEEMARRIGDADFADRCRRIFEAGKANSVKRLFNGEYFIQQVDLTQHPDWQYGDGCLSDQLFGQGWAHQVGLGYVYPPETVKAALDSIWKYCWAPDVAPQNKAHPPERWFAYPGEAGLFTCTWPKGDHMGPKSTRYRNEIWTGIEYQVAGHMAWEGMLMQCLAICRAVHDRYHPSRRNPFNEIECGDHYARAMAAWGVVTALSGFEYDGPRGHIGFAPRFKPEEFRAVFTAASGWGQILQKRTAKDQTQEIRVILGEVQVKSLAFEVAAGAKVGAVEITAGGPAITASVEQVGQRVMIGLPAGITVTQGGSLTARIGLG